MIKLLANFFFLHWWGKSWLNRTFFGSEIVVLRSGEDKPQHRLIWWKLSQKIRWCGRFLLLLVSSSVSANAVNLCLSQNELHICLQLLWLSLIQKSINKWVTYQTWESIMSEWFMLFFLRTWQYTDSNGNLQNSISFKLSSSFKVKRGQFDHWPTNSISAEI